MKIVRIKKINLLLLIILTFCILGVFRVSAQKYPNEFSIYCEGGYAAFIFQKAISKTTSSKGYGGDAGVGFTYFFSQNLGLHTSVGVGFFNVNNQLRQLAFIMLKLEDCEGYLYDLHTTLNNYNENHKSIFVSLPLMLQYQTKLEPISNQKKNNKAGFYAMMGAKALFLLNNNYTSKTTSLSNAAYYPEFDTWINSQPALGLGSFKGCSVNGKLDFNVLIMFAFEAGIKWQIGKKLFLYTGAYFDCGLHDTTKKARVPYNSFTTQEPPTDLALLEFAKRMNLMAVGIKVRLAFVGSKSH